MAFTLQMSTNGIAYAAIAILIVFCIYLVRRYLTRLKEFTKDPYKKKENEYDDIRDEIERDI